MAWHHVNGEGEGKEAASQEQKRRPPEGGLSVVASETAYTE